jgi:tetratricopeptide (TPR) repeat protein
VNESTTSVVFLGRDAELEALRSHHRSARGGAPTIVLLGGASGIGKTALVGQFLAELGEQVAPDEKPPIILSGRCYQRETAPFKAITRIVEELAHWLGRGAVEPEEVLPERMGELRALFPVLRTVGPPPQLQQQLAGEPSQLRRQAFQAFRELLHRLTRLRTVVVFIDDLHWADDATFDLLFSLARPPQGPPLLLLATYREERIDRSPAFDRFAQMVLRWPDATSLELEPLSPAETERLVAALLRQSVSLDLAADAQLVADLAREAEGSPFWAGELVSYVRSQLDRQPADTDGGDGPLLDPARIRLENVLSRRIELLPGPSRRLLQVLATAGDPLPQQVLAEAAAIAQSSADWEAGITRLRAERLVRTSGQGSAEQIDTYHDRIRETVAASLVEAERREIHARLARAMENCGPERVEFLAAHWTAAGDPDAARSFVVRAADRAMETLAFERAAELYRQALELDPEGKRRLRRCLADALNYDGKAAQAAQAYLAAAGETTAEMSLELRGLAAEQYLRAGQISRGLATQREVLQEVGIRAPESPLGALLSAGLQRMALRLRGLGFRERGETELPRETLARLEVLRSACTYLPLVDIILSVDLNTRYVRYATRAGDVRHHGLSLVYEAAHRATYGGPRNIANGRKLMELGSSYVDRSGDQRAKGIELILKGFIEFFDGAWQAGVEHTAEAERVLTKCRGGHWELGQAKLWYGMNQQELGEFRSLRERLDHWVSEAVRLGDRFSATSLRTRLNLVWLAADEPEKARAEIEGALDTWPEGVFSLQHYWHMRARMEQHLYLGEGERAVDLFREARDGFYRSQLRHVQIIRAEADYARGRACVLAAAKGADSVWLREARRVARSLLREGMGYTRAWGSVVAAGVARVEGERERELIARLDASMELARQASLWAHLAALRIGKGQLLGGEPGAALVIQGERWMQAHGIERPLLMSRLLAPGVVV